MIIYCCKCDKDVNAELTKGNIIYPHRTDLYNKNFYKCPHCGNYVGCHPGTTRPLGCIPTYEIRLARHRLHDIMDPLWKDGLISRMKLYKTISKRIGYNFHVGNIKSVTECFEIYDTVLDIKQELAISRGKTVPISC